MANNNTSLRELRDLEEDGWPMLCESCIGVIEQMSPRFHMECKICKRPFRLFKWRARPGQVYKETQICLTCSMLKQMCQVCTLDLGYELPVQAVAEAHSEAEAGIEYEPGNPLAAEVCPLYLRGECSGARGCPYRHEIPLTQALTDIDNGMSSVALETTQ